MELHERPGWGFRETNRVLIYERPDSGAWVHWVYLDGKFMPFFHFEVYEPWSLWLFRNLKKKFANWSSDWGQWPLFTMADEDSDALDRLREHFGFQYLKEIPCSDGKVRRLYVHYGHKKVSK